MAFNNFPYTSFQDLNLDWVLQKVKQAATTASQAASTVGQYANRLTQVENSDSAQNTRITSVENVNTQQNTRIGELETAETAQNNRISALESSDTQQDTDIYNASEAALTAQRDATIAIQMANLIAENQAFYCEINATQSPFTSSKNYTALYNIIYTQKKTVNFILTDASNVKYETALAYVGSDKIRAIFIMDRANSSQSYGVIYADILSNNTVELRTDSITTGGGGSVADAVLYVAQTLTEAQKAQARQNIGAGTSDVEDAVQYVPQTLTDAQKAQARTNIGAGTSNITDAVQYVAQTLTEAQKAQARTNIGAGTGTSIVRVNASDGTITITDPNLNIGEPVTYQYRTIFPIVAVYSNGQYTFDRNQADILSAITRGQLPVVRYHVTDNNNNIYREWVFDYYSFYQEDVLISFNGLDENGNISRLMWYASTGKATETITVALPKATGADDGKIPMVNSFGNYQLVSIPAAETTSFGT